MVLEDVLLLKGIVEKINSERAEGLGRFSFDFHEFAPGHYDVQISTEHCIYPSELQRISTVAGDLGLVWFIGGIQSSARFIMQ